MKKVRLATVSDGPGWLKLAREVEPLFGPMVEDPGFREGLARAIQEKNAFCITEEKADAGTSLDGGIVISKAENEILWLAVAESSRGRGIGAALLSEAVNCLDKTRPIQVTTFDGTVPAGLPARKLYQTLGFIDGDPGEVNPAGIPTVTMVLLN